MNDLRPKGGNDPPQVHVRLVRERVGIHEPDTKAMSMHVRKTGYVVLVTDPFHEHGVQFPIVRHDKSTRVW